MATTQYIGARYVPIFYTNPDDNSNNWKSGVVYDPLTVVTDLNQSYTSKIPVPASVGRPSENPTYWILTGAYSAQVEQYRQEVEQVASDLESVATDITDLQDDINQIRGSKAVFIGDSYLSNTETNWATYMASYLELDDYVISYRGGTGFVGAVDGITFYELVQNAVVENPEEINYVFFAGGTNDIFDSTINSVVNRIKTVCDLARTRFPNAKIYVAMSDGEINSDYNWTRRDTLYRFYAEGCAQAGVMFCGAVGTGCKLFRSTYLQSDLKHPTPAGSADIARRYIDGMNGRTICTNFFSIANVYYVREENDILDVSFFFRQAFTVSVSSYTCDGQTDVALPGPTGHIITTSDNFSVASVMVMARSSEGYFLMQGRLEPTPSGFNIRLYDLNSENSNFRTLTNLSQINILGGSSCHMPAHCLG